MNLKTVTRRKFMKGAGVAGLVSFFTASPAAAHTPTRSVVDARLDIYKYPDRTTIIPHDGTGVIDFTNVRIELILEFARRDADGNPLGGQSTEHWTTRIDVFGEDPTERHTRLVRLWDTLWHHQNTTGRFNPTEVFQANTYRFLPGRGRIEVEIIADESGFTKKFEVPFTVVTPPHLEP